MEQINDKTNKKLSWKKIVGIVMLVLFIIPYLNGDSTLINDFSVQGIGYNLWGLFLLIYGAYLTYKGCKN